MIAVLMAAAMGAGGAGGGGAPPWETPAWAAFRTAWDTAGASDSVAAVDEQLARLPQIERGLATLVPPKVAAALAAGLRANLESWRTALEPPRGKPPRPDWPARLRGDLDDLSRDHASLEELRRLGWGDPWIEGKLAPDVARLAEGVAADADVVEREYPKEKRLVRDARALLERVRRSLPPPPPR